MKKILLGLLILIVCIAMTACGASSEADKPLTDSQGLEYTLLSDGTYSVSGRNAKNKGPEEIVIPAEINGKAVTVIESFAFKNFWMNKVTVADSVTEIGEGAFMFCAELQYVTLPSGLTVINQNTFRGCISLLEIDIPSRVKTIEKWAFRGCKRLETVSLPESLERINEFAFYECDALNDVNITDLGAWCKIDFDNKFSNPLYYGKQLLINGEELSELRIPDGTEVILPYTFINCLSIKSIIVPTSLTSVGEGAFEGCENLSSRNYYGTHEAWRSINIADNNSSLYESLLYAYSKTKPDSYGLYWYTDGDKTHIWGALNYVMMPSANGYAVANGVGERIEIDSEYKFMPVRAVNSGALKNHTEISLLILGSNIETVGDSAFRGCSNMRDVVVPVSLSKIESDAFLGCTLLTRVYYHGTSDEWTSIDIEDGNNNIRNADIYFYSETEPTEDGSFWHYVDGEPTPWN
jgi:hypothetical protein